MDQPSIVCSDCGKKPVKAKGLCTACYQRFRRRNVESARLAHRAANKRYRLTHPNYKESRRGIERRRRYNLSNDEFVALMDRAEHKCELCKQPHRKLCIDHDHQTGTVRGVLCDRCNKALGAYEYIASFGDALAAYLNGII